MVEIKCGLVHAKRSNWEPFAEVVLPTLPRIGDGIWALDGKMPQRYVVRTVEFNVTEVGKIGKVFLMVETARLGETTRSF